MNTLRPRRTKTRLDADGKFRNHTARVRAHHCSTQNFATRVLEYGDLGEAFGDTLTPAAIDFCHLALTHTIQIFSYK